jgi:hypothetical protein
MSGKGSVFSNDLLKAIFQATGIANLVDNASSSPLTNLYIALHTADPTTTAGSGTVNTQNASECSYTGYARVAVARSSGGFSVSGNTVNPAAAVTFGQRTDNASQTATYWSIGVASTGATKILYSGQITTPSGGIVISQNVTPQLTTASQVTEA